MDSYNVSVAPSVNGITNMVVTAWDEEHAKQQVRCFKDGGKNFFPISVKRIKCTIS